MKHVCRIILKGITDSTIKIDELAQIKIQLSICVPEMVVDLVKDPIFCKFCVSALHSAYNFKNLCLSTEQHIQNYSLKVLRSKSIDIEDLLYDLQRSTSCSVCENNSEDKSTMKDGRAVTPIGNLLLPDGNLQSFKIESNMCQLSVTLPIDVSNKINNVNSVTLNKFNKPVIQLTADKINFVLNDTLQSTPIQPRLIKQEGEIEDITIKEENIALPKVELRSYEGYEDNLFEVAESKNYTVEVKSLYNKCTILQSNSATRNCFVKPPRRPDAVVHKRNRFICKICKFTTRTKYYLKKHELIHDKTKCFSCAWCKFHTVLKRSLIIHLRTHTGEKPFACKMCTFRSSQKPSLDDHLRIHTGEKQFACNVCTYRSSQKQNLNRHLQMHSGEKPFACNVCKFRTAKKSYLQQHLRAHSKEKAFACNICNSTFSHRPNLQRHMKKHQNPTLTCNICNYQCRYKQELEIHIKYHSADKVYTCSTCKYITLSKKSLSRHGKIHS